MEKKELLIIVKDNSTGCDLIVALSSNPDFLDNTSHIIVERHVSARQMLFDSMMTAPQQIYANEVYKITNQLQDTLNYPVIDTPKSHIRDRQKQDRYRAQHHSRRK